MSNTFKTVGDVYEHMLKLNSHMQFFAYMPSPEMHAKHKPRLLKPLNTWEIETFYVLYAIMANEFYNGGGDARVMQKILTDLATFPADGRDLFDLFVGRLLEDHGALLLLHPGDQAAKVGGDHSVTGIIQPEISTHFHAPGDLNQYNIVGNAAVPTVVGPVPPHLLAPASVAKTNHYPNADYEAAAANAQVNANAPANVIAPVLPTYGAASAQPAYEDLNGFLSPEAFAALFEGFEGYGQAADSQPVQSCPGPEHVPQQSSSSVPSENLGFQYATIFEGLQSAEAQASQVPSVNGVSQQVYYHPAPENTMYYAQPNAMHPQGPLQIEYQAPPSLRLDIPPVPLGPVSGSGAGKRKAEESLSPQSLSPYPRFSNSLSPIYAYESPASSSYTTPPPLPAPGTISHRFTCSWRIGTRSCTTIIRAEDIWDHLRIVHHVQVRREDQKIRCEAAERACSGTLCKPENLAAHVLKFHAAGGEQLALCVEPGCGGVVRADKLSVSAKYYCVECVLQGKDTRKRRRID